MKFTKLCLMFTAATLAVGAFADAANVLITFSTDGSETYADEKPVLPGEWYALCWSANSTFAGLTIDCEPVDADDEVLIVAPLAKTLANGNVGCPYVVFQVDSANAPAGGNYFVYLLDTRDATGDVVSAATTSEKTGKRIPATSVNGSVAAKGYTASSSLGATQTGDEVAVATDSWVETAIAEVKQPKITAFKVDGANVKITVADMIPGVKYNVMLGETPSTLTTYGLEVPKTGVEEAEFVIAPDDAKFFKVVREPLSK